MQAPCYPKLHVQLSKDTREMTDVELKVWPSETGSQWEMRRLFLHVVERRPLDLGRYIKRELREISDILQKLQGDDTISKPETQLLKAGQEVEEDVRDQWTCRTLALLAIMSSESSAIRQAGKRERSLRIFQAFLTRFVGHQAASEICSEEIPAAACGLCTYRPNANNQCRHLQKVLVAVAPGEDAPSVENLCKLLVCLSGATTCPTLAFWFGAVLQDCSLSVEACLDEADFEEDPLRSLPVRTGKRRLGVVDADFKRAAIQRAKAARSSSVTSFLSDRDDERARGSGNWVHDSLRQNLATGWLTWGSGGVVFLAPDAVRAGGEDTIAYQFWHASSATGGWLPPQALVPAIFKTMPL